MITLSAALALGGDLEPLRAVVTIGLCLRFTTMLEDIGNAVNGIEERRQMMNHLSSVMDAQPLPEPQTSSLMGEPGAVELIDVTFGYEEGTTVLREVDLRVPARTMCAVVGPSGAGKTTVARLVARFYDVWSGQVRVGGADVRSLTTKDLMEQGTEDGTFEKAEQDMVDRIFHMSDQTASALMTPRTQIAWIDLAEPQAEQLRVIRRTPHNVFPVAYENLDDFRGVVYAKELLDAVLGGTDLDLAAYIREPLFVPRTMEGLRVLEKFRSGDIHEAVVLDEYGGVVGFITMDDIMQEIIGSADDDAPASARMGAEEEQNWVFDGLYPIDEFKEEFGIDELPDEDHDHFHTLGGFVTAQIGRIPKAGETCTWDGFTFEILRMDRARVAQIRMTRTEGEEEAS